MDFADPAGSAERLCTWHRGPSTTTRLVRVDAATTSSRGAGVYACVDCRTRDGLTPLDTLAPAQLYKQLEATAINFLGRGRSA
ncbi:hypothetical protein [Streptomyces sp. NBC_01497]|uniref:hypothetical protein n=1 Tax=Streptomyces sp. NBC_01497 TaxID=2903885 RepID=UPI002E2F873A|nr:hypothetical protein [Streptomyces sp. NBC_01497]